MNREQVFYYLCIGTKQMQKVKPIIVGLTYESYHEIMRESNGAKI